MGSFWFLCFTTTSTCGFCLASDSMWLRMYVRVFAEEGHLSQYSNTSLRMCGRNATCPLAGRERSCALSSCRMFVYRMKREQNGKTGDERSLKRFLLSDFHDGARDAVHDSRTEEEALARAPRESRQR